jgi:hypothetical protein
MLQKKHSLNPVIALQMVGTKLYLSFHLENLLMILSAPGINKWQEEGSKQYDHLYFTILM